jgi:ParB/RepB/Spo0J family partition protein
MPDKSTLPDYKLENVNVSQIDIGIRIRKDFGNLAAFAGDIAEFGLHHPILVLDKKYSPEPEVDMDTKPYLLLAGERRLQAHLLLGLSEIPCKITTKHLTLWEIKVIELHENIQRKDMTPFEEASLKAELHQRYQDEFGVKKSGPNQSGHSLADTAELLGESKANISMDIKIAKLGDAIPELKTVKTKSEARKLIKNVEEQLVREEQAKRALAKTQAQQGTLLKSENKIRGDLMDRYIVGDFFEQIKQVHERTIDLIEIDPDWGIMLKAAVEDRGALTADQYRDVAPEHYRQMVSNIAQECYRVMKDNSWIIFWYSLEDWHQDTRELLEYEGFKVCPMPAVWIHTSNYTAAPAYRLGQRTECFFYARKGDVKLGELGHSQTFTFRTAKKNERFHVAEKPIELYEEILNTFLGEGRVAATTITGFAGSGNFLLAADNLGHNSIGFDLSQGFKDGYIVKVNSQAPGQYKTYIP